MFIHQLFEKAAQEFAFKPAVTFEDQSLNYQELNDLANQIAVTLNENGVRAGDIVGLSVGRSPELIASIIAILKCGAAYLPLDTEYPAERLHYMIEHSKVKHLLVDSKAGSVLIAKDCKKIILNDLNTARKGIIPPLSDHEKVNLCYVIYTSGSTGKPKGVCLGHRALTNLILWQNEETELKNGSVTLQFTPVSFDVHFQEIFSTLTSGGHLILISEESRLNPSELLKVITKNNVGRLFLPYVALNQLSEMAVAEKLYPSTLKEIITAGEQLKITPAIRSFFRMLGDCTLYNHYGPSETHVVTSHKLSGDSESWPGLPPIGSEVTNCKVLILDEQMKEVASGCDGEVYLGGISLADGYLNSPELTAERFINTSQFGRLYKTGDIGSMDVNRVVTYSDRKDGQVKVRGYRVETGEIELLIMKSKNVRQCVVTVRSDNSESYLCAYICGDSNLYDIRESLKQSLPHYMIPSHFIRLDTLPLTPSGKVDKGLLPPPSTSRPELKEAYQAPETELEEKITTVWSKYLNLEQIGTDDSFFDLGGSSLLALKVMIELNEFMPKKLSVTQFFQYPTVRKLAAFLNGKSQQTKNYVKKTSSENDIAIISMTGRFPSAGNIDELWKNLIEGKNCLEKFSLNETHPGIPHEVKMDPNFVPVEGKFPDDHFFDYKFFGMTPREAEMMDPQQRKFLEIATEALELSGHTPQNFEGAIGVFAGMGNSLYGNLVQEHPDKVKDMGDFNVMLGLEKDYIATRVAYKLNLTGPAVSLHTGCSTSLVAIIEAVKSLRNGDCDMALAGGISISGMEKRGHLFQEGGILSKDGLCRPFDENASGTIFTDGAGLLVLRRLSEAEKDGDNILAVIKGVGINNDGADKMSFTAPSIPGQTDVILRAHADAGIEASSIGYVEAHGTATPVGDPIEVEALSKAFKSSTDEKTFCYLGSIKSNLGHLTAAAGVAGVIKATLALKHKKIPGTANFKSPNKFLNLSDTPFIVTSSSTEFPLLSEKRAAGVSSFGVGGTNAHIILQEYQSPVIPENSVGKPLLFKLSAKNEKQLDEMESSLKNHLKNLPEDQWPHLAYTLDVGRVEHSFRRVLIAKDKTDLDKSSIRGKTLKELPLYYAFPGQGSQYLKMGRKLSQSSMIFKSHFDEACRLLNQHVNYKIEDIINGDDQEKINDTYYTQPAIFIIEYSLARTFQDLGFKPKGLIGHSIGEYVAAVIAGIFSLEDGLKIIAKRAELVSTIPKGIMLSVAAPAETVAQLIKDYEVDIAAINAPASCVVAGAAEDIESFKKFVTSLGHASIELKTSHAFHSRMMLPAVKELKEFVGQFELKHPLIPVISSVTGKQETDLLATPDYWASHLVNCVNFAPSIQSIIERENVIFLETGPKAVLTGLIRKQLAVLNNKDSSAVSIISESPDSEDSGVMKSIGQLWLYGLNPSDTSLFYEEHERRRVPGPTYAFEKHYCWLDLKTNSKSKTIQNPEGSLMSSKKSKLIQRLTEIFEKSSGIDVSGCGPEMSFLEMGMDSLFLTQVALKLKKEYSVNITFRQLLEQYSNLNLLADSLLDKIPDEKEAPVTVTHIPAPVAQVETTFHADASGVEAIFNRQLEIMNQQIQLLKGTPAAPVKTEALSTAEKTVKPVIAMERSKEAFGAAARIKKEKSGQITSEQQKKLNDFFAEYCEKTKLSKKFTQDFRKTHADPRVVTGFKPESKEIIYPIVVNKSQGQKLWDLDGNEYIDMICGFGSNFFGNGNERIKSLITKQIEDGVEVGPQHPLTGEVSRLVCELTGNDRAAFCNTGSEAVLGAMRIARTVTGRDKIIVFSGSYHGINDEVILRSSQGIAYPASPGIPDSAVANMIVLDYGTDESLEIIKNISHEVAAVLVEPVQSRRCDFRPVEFLKEVRKITEATETCLIFDEVITGFRIHPGGAQAHFGIRADLCTYGKIVGGGFSIGVISGKSKYMDALDGGHWNFGDDSTPEVGVTYFAGTFVRHPLALAAAKGALEIIKEGGAEMLRNLTERADSFARSINNLLEANHVPLEMHNFGSLMKPKWKHEIPGGEVLFALLRYNGVHAFDGFPWFVNLAHTEKDLQFVLNVFQKSITRMQQMGLLPEVKTSGVFNADKAPVPGARIGKDEAGNPAWFMENPAKTGEYLMIEG